MSTCKCIMKMCINYGDNNVISVLFHLSQLPFDTPHRTNTPQNTVDKLVQRANASLLIGTSSWKEQFIEALTVSAGNLK